MVSLRFGLLYGMALTIGFYVSHLVLGTSSDNFSMGEVVGYSIMLISSLAVVMGVKEYKHKNYPKPLGFLQALTVGLSISVIAASLFALYNWLYLEYINPTFTATYVQYSEQQIRMSGLEQAIMDQQLAELAKYAQLMSSNLNQSLVMFVTVLIIGLLFSIVSAAAMRTSNK
jgi:hypothetical protein